MTDRRRVPADYSGLVEHTIVESGIRYQSVKRPVSRRFFYAAWPTIVQVHSTSWTPSSHLRLKSPSTGGVTRYTRNVQSSRCRVLAGSHSVYICIYIIIGSIRQQKQEKDKLTMSASCRATAVPIQRIIFNVFMGYLFPLRFVYEDQLTTVTVKLFRRVGSTSLALRND